MSDRTRDVRPTVRTGVALNVLGLALFIVALTAHVSLWSAARGGKAVTFLLGPESLLPLLGMLVLCGLLMVVHELVHGAAALTLGHRPTFGVAMFGKVLPALTTSTPGAIYSRAGFLWFGIAPTLVLTPVLALAVGLLPWGGWLVLPAAVVLSGCIGDWWLISHVLRAPSGTRFEDLADAVRLHLPG